MSNILGLALPIHVFLFMRRISGESRRRTALKVFVFGLGALVSVMLAMMLTLAVTTIGA